MLKLLILSSIAAASALVVGPLAAPTHAASRVAVSPVMACNGGKGGSGGMGPPKDKMRRGKLKALIQAADSADGVKAILLSSQTESLVMKMNWKVRKFAKRKIAKRAAQFDVEVPAAFAGFNQAKQNTRKSELVASVTGMSPRNQAAADALAKLRFS